VTQQPKLPCTFLRPPQWHSQGTWQPASPVQKGGSTAAWEPFPHPPHPYTTNTTLPPALTLHPPPYTLPLQSRAVLLATPPQTPPLTSPPLVGSPPFPQTTNYSDPWPATGTPPALLSLCLLALATLSQGAVAPASGPRKIAVVATAPAAATTAAVAPVSKFEHGYAPLMSFCTVPYSKSRVQHSTVQQSAVKCTCSTWAPGRLQSWPRHLLPPPLQLTHPSVSLSSHVLPWCSTVQYSKYSIPRAVPVAYWCR